MLNAEKRKPLKKIIQIFFKNEERKKMSQYLRKERIWKESTKQKGIN